ncbi:hypothetical protein [Aestuariivirga sp.]|uniref:hypothetical protein n=1 Tax=Aestuariivirga sp. TaxID=2650926 RepID=UPI0039E4C45F
MTLPQADQASISSCAALLTRLKDTIVKETEGLSGGAVQANIAETKTHLLRDLMTMERNPPPPEARKILAPLLGEVRAALARNQSVLKAHMEAVASVSSIIVDSIRKAESDGTYSRSPRC